VVEPVSRTAKAAGFAVAPTASMLPAVARFVSKEGASEGRHLGHRSGGCHGIGRHAAGTKLGVSPGGSATTGLDVSEGGPIPWASVADT